MMFKNVGLLKLWKLVVDDFSFFYFAVKMDVIQFFVLLDRLVKLRNCIASKLNSFSLAFVT